MSNKNVGLNLDSILMPLHYFIFFHISSKLNFLLRDTMRFKCRNDRFYWMTFTMKRLMLMLTYIDMNRLLCWYDNFTYGLKNNGLRKYESTLNVWWIMILCQPWCYTTNIAYISASLINLKTESTSEVMRVKGTGFLRQVNRMKKVKLNITVSHILLEMYQSSWKVSKS